MSARIRSIFVLAAVSVVGMDAFVLWALHGLGMPGLQAIGGWGMLGAGLLVVAVLAVNLLFLLVLLYRMAARADTFSEQSP